MSVRVTFKGESFKVQTLRAMKFNFSQMSIGVTNAAREMATEIVTRGRSDIAGAGKFGRRWTEGLKADVQPKTGALINARVTISHDQPNFDIFENGGVIRGNPLLWIPLSYTGITMRARDYAASAGGLVYVQPRSSGRPLLLSRNDRLPKYFGIASVTIPKKFHIRQICEQVTAKFDTIYGRHLKV